MKRIVATVALSFVWFTAVCLDAQKSTTAQTGAVEFLSRSLTGLMQSFSVNCIGYEKPRTLA